MANNKQLRRIIGTRCTNHFLAPQDKIWSTVSMTQPTFFTVWLSFNLYRSWPREDQQAATVGWAAMSRILVKFILVRSSKNGYT